MRLYQLDDGQTIDLDKVAAVQFNPSADDSLHIFMQGDTANAIVVSYANGSITDGGLTEDNLVTTGYNNLMAAIASTQSPPVPSFRALSNLVLASVSPAPPASVPIAGGGKVTLIGGGFIRPMFVYIQNGVTQIACSGVTVVSPTKLTFLNGGGAANTYDLLVGYVNFASDLANTNFYATMAQVLKLA